MPEIINAMSEIFDTLSKYLAAAGGAVLIFAGIKTLRRLYRKLKRVLRFFKW